ncbi:MAG: bifunctional non-ous end joining protein LigD [Actinomycetota bacterium]|jgi:bifunctional non-homologous end joining protein LigD|nr:bifunctional non-ous end joining protein LigD [Actinomycetota bacterium]
MKKTETRRVGNRTLQLSNLEKVFYPETGFTKGDVISYYDSVSEVLLPHLKGRPLTMKRYPDGAAGKFFYEKRCPPHAPEWIKTVTIKRKRDDQDIPYCLIENRAALLWAANLGNLELHIGLARASDIFKPTAVVFDLDPDPELGIIGCCKVAVWLRDKLQSLGLESFPKTSGSKGIQMFAPLNTKVSFDETGSFAHALATEVQNEHPDDVVTKMAKDLRSGKVFIDWSQNDNHKTTACVYTLRAKEFPSASTPLEWREVEAALKHKKAERLFFTSDQLLKRVEQKGDLFEPVLKLKQKLPKGFGK